MPGTLCAIRLHEKSLVKLGMNILKKLNLTSYEPHGEEIFEQRPDPRPMFTKIQVYSYITLAVATFIALEVIGWDWSVFVIIWIGLFFAILLTTLLAHWAYRSEARNIVFRIRSNGLEVDVKESYVFIPFEKILWAGNSPRGIVHKIHKDFNIKRSDYIVLQLADMVGINWTVIFCEGDRNKAFLFNGPTSFFHMVSLEIKKRNMDSILQV
jgi:hypothetical protein